MLDHRQRSYLKLPQGEIMEVNGVAHIFLTASNYERSREFYRELLPFLGLHHFCFCASAPTTLRRMG